MITFTKAFQTSTGETFASLKEAQQSELDVLLNKASTPTEAEAVFVLKIVGTILDNADQVVDILTTTPNSRPKGRSVNGGKKPRKAKAAAAPAEPEAAQ